MLAFLKAPWPWYVAGPLIGLFIPVLLILGNRSFGVSSSLRDICAACLPANISFFKYDWKKESWNMFFVAGIVLGGWIAGSFMEGDHAVALNSQTEQLLRSAGVSDFSGLSPKDIFGADQVMSIRGLIFFVVGGFLVGFGTRYAGGCTSGHSIMGLSTLQWPSLVATCCFMAGGFFMSWIVVPYLLRF